MKTIHVKKEMDSHKTSYHNLQIRKTFYCFGFFLTTAVYGDRHTQNIIL